MITLSLNDIRKHSPCEPGWRKLLKYLNKKESDDELFPLETVLDSNGLPDAHWCLRALEGKEKEIRLYLLVPYARRVQHLMTDPRSLHAIDVAEKYVKGEATDEELAAAYAAADAAARAAADAADAAYAAAWAAREAWAVDVAWAASSAAWAADAAWEAADAATSAADAAAWTAVDATERLAQEDIFRKFCREEK